MCSEFPSLCLLERSHGHPQHLKTDNDKIEMDLLNFGYHSHLHLVEAWQYSGSRCAESNVSVLTQMVTLPLPIPSSFICCLTKESAEGKEHIFNLHLQMIQ